VLCRQQQSSSVSLGSLTPTPVAVLDHMLKTCWLRDGDLLYDLGCGDGRIVFEAARSKRVRAGVWVCRRGLAHRALA
jgi:hypothetical protein